MELENNKIKICHVMSNLGIGGMENGVVNICNYLNRSLFEPIILCIKGEGPMRERLRDDVAVYNLNLGKSKLFLRPLKISRFFRITKPDIVHTHGWGAGLLDGVLGAKLAGIKNIINGEHGSFFLNRRQVFAQKILLKLCDNILAVSDSLRDKISTYFNIPANRITVIHNGVNTDLFHGKYNEANIYEKILGYGFDISSDDYIIGVVGSLRPVKNNIMLLKAVNSIRKRGLLPNLKVIFIGDGPEKADLVKYCKRNNLDNTVGFLGQMDDVHELYSIIDGLVLCSLSEGMSNVIIEAMASGVPVICSEGADLKREVVKDSFNGFVVSNNDTDALEKAIMNMSEGAVRGKMAINARNYIHTAYTISAMVKKYEDFYSSISTGE